MKIEKLYIAMCSGGKDSVATLILAHIYKEPLDFVLYSEPMFDNETSAEYPEHRDFIYNTLKPWVESVLKVPFVIVKGTKTYKEVFKHKLSRGPKKGMTHGYMLRGMCDMNSYGKRAPIHNYIRDNCPNGCYEYVGIAYDEAKRYEKLKKHQTKISLLYKYHITEEEAVLLTKEWGLYSPAYSVSHRNGCWFCPNISDTALAYMVDSHPILINKLMGLDLYARKHCTAYPQFRAEESLLQAVKRLQRKGLIKTRPIWVDLGRKG